MSPSRNRLLVGLGVLAVVSFVGGLGLAVFDPGEVAVRSHGADTFSRSAIGHRGFARWLRAVGMPVVISRAGTAGKSGPDTALFVLEPPPDVRPERLVRLIDASDAEVVLLTLPKWQGAVEDDGDPWITGVEVVVDDARNGLLDALGLSARSVDASAGAWRWQADGAAPDVRLTSPRGVTGDGLEPILSRGDAVIVGETWRDGTRLVLVGDPDLLANARLVHHAPLLAELLGGVLGLDPARHSVIIDETLHGHVSTASLARQLFEFPLAALTIQALVLIGVGLLLGARRFGAPRARDGGLDRGRRALVDNTAELGHFAGHDADALDRYGALLTERVAQALHAPSGLEPAERLAWMARIGRARGVQRDPRALLNAAGTAPPNARLAAARRLHRWFQLMRGAPATGEPNDV